MNKLKGFISYAPEDKEYFQLLQDGLRKHGKRSTIIDSDLWHDGKILPGTLWHESIQSHIKECDFAVLLVSADFLASEYIEEYEFKKFLERQEAEGFPFFPVLVNHCDLSNWDQLNARQFFRPRGDEYDLPLKDELTFGDLVEYNKSSGAVLKAWLRHRDTGQGDAPRFDAATDPEALRADRRRRHRLERGR